MAEDKYILQAAALLMGVYGEDAVVYATARMEELDGESGSHELETWAQITVKLRELSYFSMWTQADNGREM